MYVLPPCEQGLPSDWGNWNVPKDTVVNISINLKKEIKLAELNIPDLENLKWYTDDTQTTYYKDRKNGVEYAVTGDIVRSITYGPKVADEKLLCNKSAPVIKY